ncbi:protein TPX2-like isoform X2 [Hibiscus syriacus]|uniref:protein TPX2-like isoform X2 n=1 Tax=Hibiscus syriacus TaxID=106335 RepID=UPI001922520F|nr:protein TPX2-like isoform X2 [Hibiscus syriacus]
MLNGIGQVMEEEFYSIEESFDDGQCFDLDYEFDAPRCFDFSSPETDWEAEEAELWFDSAESYAPSPFVIKLKWRCDINGDGEFSNGSTECDEYSGEACNGCCGGTQVAKTDSPAKASPSKSSTLMQPTASYLAKQNQSRTGLSNQFQNRLHKSADRFNKSVSFNEDATKRQKLEFGYLRKVAHLKHQSKFEHKEPKTVVRSLDGVPSKPKATIPREPELQTARRAQRNMSKNKEESDESAKSKVHSFKALPLNKKILEAPSLPLPKKSLPQPPEFQVFHLRTSERAKQHAYNNAMKVSMHVSTSRNENARLRSFNSINSLKEEKHEAIKKSKACAPNKKVSSGKGANGVLQNMNQATATTRLPDELPIELLNKLSLSSERHSGEKSQEIMAISERQIMKVAKELLQRNGRMQYPCRRVNNIEIGRQENISRRLRLDVV